MGMALGFDLEKLARKSNHNNSITALTHSLTLVKPPITRAGIRTPFTLWRLDLKCGRVKTALSEGATTALAATTLCVGHTLQRSGTQTIWPPGVNTVSRSTNGNL